MNDNEINKQEKNNVISIPKHLLERAETTPSNLFQKIDSHDNTTTNSNDMSLRKRFNQFKKDSISANEQRVKEIRDDINNKKSMDENIRPYLAAFGTLGGAVAIAGAPIAFAIGGGALLCGAATIRSSFKKIEGLEEERKQLRKEINRYESVGFDLDGLLNGDSGVLVKMQDRFFKHINEEEMKSGDDSYKRFVERTMKGNPELLKVMERTGDKFNSVLESLKDEADFRNELSVVSLSDRKKEISRQENNSKNKLN